jgi:hypothetical protein
MRLKRCFWFGALLAFCIASAGQAYGASIGKADDIASGASGNTVFFGHYPQTDAGTSAPLGVVSISAQYENSTYDNSKVGIRYYTIDPIGWRVLSNAGGKVFLLSEENLDAKPYHEPGTSVTWETSTVRAWLNGTSAGNFLHDAFTPEEAGAIAGTPVVNDDNLTYGTSGGSPTTDRIFFLSIAEAVSGFADDASRQSRNTGYAERINGMYAAGNPYFWWLRSPGSSVSDAAIVGDSGPVYASGSGVNDSAIGVRPALNLNLSSVFFTSAAAGGKSVLTIPSLTDNTSPGPGDDLKLTLKDPSQTLTVIASEAQKTQSVSLPGSLEFSYVGARTGTNQYVSCILESGGAITHYGKLADNLAVSSGTLSVPLPASLQDGTYTLKIFSEQANDDKYTDFAGDPATMTLTVSGGGQTASVSNFSGGLPSNGSSSGSGGGGGGGGCSTGFASLAGLALALAALAGKRG